MALQLMQRARRPARGEISGRGVDPQLLLADRQRDQPGVGDAPDADRGDSTLVIPPRVAHQIVNTGAAPLVTVAAFSWTPVGTFLPDGAPLELPWAS